MPEAVQLGLAYGFRMPSIDGYKPRSSEHYEAGWKHFLDNGMLEVSAYYKTRRNVVALRPEVFVEDGQWQEYIMVGNGDSYGAGCISTRTGSGGSCNCRIRTHGVGSGSASCPTTARCLRCTTFRIS